MGGSAFRRDYSVLEIVTVLARIAPKGFPALATLTLRSWKRRQARMRHKLRDWFFTAS